MVDPGRPARYGVEVRELRHHVRRGDQQWRREIETLRHDPAELCARVLAHEAAPPGRRERDVPDGKAEPPAAWDCEPARDDSADGEIEEDRREHKAYREIAHILDGRSAGRLRLGLERADVAAPRIVAIESEVGPFGATSSAVMRHSTPPVAKTKPRPATVPRIDTYAHGR